MKTSIVIRDELTQAQENRDLAQGQFYLDHGINLGYGYNLNLSGKSSEVIKLLEDIGFKRILNSGLNIEFWN